MSTLIDTLTPEQKQQAFDRLVSQEQGARILQALKYGLAGGAILGGGVSLAQRIGRKLRPSKSTYTSPVVGKVYIPDNKLAKQQLLEKEAFWDDIKSFGQSLSGDAAAATPARTGVVGHVDQMSTTPAYAALAIATGLPLGWWAARALLHKSDAYRRSNELEDVQREYEQELQSYAATKAKPGVRKRASLIELQVSKLAANTYELSNKLAWIPELKQVLTAYLIGAPLIAGAIGFSNQWDKGDHKDLQAAENKLQLMREKSNPTGSLLTVDYVPEPNRAGNSIEQKNNVKQRLIDEAVEEVPQYIL